MPRQSAASLATLKVAGKPARLQPREGVPAAVKAIFRDLVASVPAEHFRPADGHLIEQYAQAIALARQAYAELEASGPVVNGRASPWIIVLEKAHRSSVALAARLRLSPQHRTDPKTAGRNQTTASAYQLMELQDDDDG
jgi:phage terminase small subunit